MMINSLLLSYLTEESGNAPIKTIVELRLMRPDLLIGVQLIAILRCKCFGNPHRFLHVKDAL